MAHSSASGPPRAPSLPTELGETHAGHEDATLASNRRWVKPAELLAR